MPNNLRNISTFETTYTNEEVLELFKGAMDCVIPDRKAVYVAVPITSGKRLWQLAAQLKMSRLDEHSSIDPELRQRAVLQPNLNDAAAAISKVREHTDNIAIDPSRLFIPKWSQQHYYDAWRWLIRNKISEVILCGDWSFSFGCIRECLNALEAGIPIRTDAGEIINSENLRQKLEAAEQTAAELHVGVPFIKEALAALD
jgi:hypothetical protein